MKQPFDMPVRSVSRQQFELLRVDYSAPEASGRIGGVQAGFPLWMGAWQLAEMRPEKSDEWRAFMSSIRGSNRRFLGRDQKRTYPKAYASGFTGMTRAGGGAFDGSATSWSENITADDDSEVTLTGLPAGFVMSQGDYIGFHWVATEESVAGLTWHALVRVVEAATGDGTGEVTVVCEPPVPSAVPLTATAYLNEPKCVMVLVPDQSKLEAIDRREAIRGGTLVAIQDIRE
jgi:hypothetical protein